MGKYEWCAPECCSFTILGPPHLGNCEQLIGASNLFQLMSGSNQIPSKYYTWERLGFMSCRSCGTSCMFTGRFCSESWSGWGDKETQKLGGDFIFWMTSNDWRLSVCFIPLYIAAVLWNTIQASLGSLCSEHLLLNPDNFTNLVRKFFVWLPCSSSLSLTHLMNFRKYLRNDVCWVLLSPCHTSTDLAEHFNYSERVCVSKGRPWPPSISASVTIKDSLLLIR